MFCRPLGMLLLGIVTLALLPVPSRAQSPETPGYKEEVLKLSKWIDDYLDRRWKELGVTPAPLAEDAIFFRRLNLDLMGKIPEVIEVQDYIDPTNKHESKRWNAVEKCLTNEAASRHFANFWRTMIIGRSANQQFQFVYPQFERWLEDRIKKHTPLDQITREIITAQRVGNQPFQQGFGPGGAPMTPAGFFAVNENKAENLAGSTARVFLGVKIECAQCHKHPFAKWTREQFWEFAAFYSGQNGNRPQPKKKANVGFVPGREIVIPEVNKVVKAKFLTGKEPQWGAFSDSQKVLAEWVTSKDNPYFSRRMADHLWAYIFGVSLLEPILEPSDDDPITHPELLNKLAKELVAHGFDQMFLIRALVHTKAYQRSSGGPELATKEDYHLFLRMPIRSLTPEQIYDSIAVATHLRDQPTYTQDMRFNQNPFGGNTPRGQFLAKFGTQERRYDPQTSILQALFMMNGKFMTERTRAESNDDIDTLVKSPQTTRKKVTTMFWMLLSRPPREEELQRLTAHMESGGPSHDTRRAIEDIYWALLNSPEFLLNH